MGDVSSLQFPLPSLSSSSPHPHFPHSYCEACWPWRTSRLVPGMHLPSFDPPISPPPPTSVFVMVKPGSNNTRGRLAPSWFSGNETSSTQSPGLPFLALALTSFIPVRPRDSQLWCCGTCPHCFQRILSAGKLYMVPGLAS